MDLEIDGTRCQGHAICYLVAPELFGVDDEGRGSVLDPHPGAELAEKARIAVQRCPERAINASTPRPDMPDRHHGPARRSTPTTAKDTNSE
jgi:ferredoxin